MKHTKNYKILIADDEIEFHQKIRFALRRSYEFEGKLDEKSIFEEVRKNHKKYDLLLLDLDLNYPNEDFKRGLENIPKLKEIAPDLPIVVATKDGSVQTAVKAMKYGAEHFLHKMEFDTKYWDSLLRDVIEHAKAHKIKRKITRVVKTKETDSFITKSKHVNGIKTELKKLSEIPNVNVLITGETGTGKEVAARYLHHHGVRKDKPFVVVNLAAIPTELLESALFGHKKGAFTDAKEDHIGYAQEANGGILFLDEIGEIPHDFQVKLLRFLENKTIRPIKGRKDIKLDIQIVSATNKNLESEIEAKNFRADLYQRLKGYQIELPPLRNRREDIVPIAKYFLSEKLPFNLDEIDLTKIFEPEVKKRLLLYNWKGNIRELRNTIDSILIKMHIMDLRKATLNCLPKEIQGFAHNVKVRDYDSGTSKISNIEVKKTHDVMMAVKELEEVEKALFAANFNKKEAGLILGKDDQKLRYMVKLKHFKNHPEIFSQFPNICKAYKLNINE